MCDFVSYPAECHGHRLDASVDIALDGLTAEFSQAFEALESSSF